MNNVHNIDITINGKEWEGMLDTAFLKKQKDVKVDGFRKGNVPKDIYIKKVGIESLYMDAVDIAMQSAYKKVLNEEKLIPECEPKVDIKSINKDELVLEFTIITKPEIKLGEYKNLGVKKDKVTVSKEEVESEIKHLRSQYAEIVIKENGTVEEGNTAVIDFEGFVDDKKLEGGSGQDYPLEIGSNTFIPGFESGLVGMKVNEEKELNLKFPENYTEDLKNKDVLFKVTVKEIKERILPELNEDFYKDLGYEDIKDEKAFEDKIKEDIKHRKSHQVEDKYVDELMQKAISNMKIELNPEIVEDEIHRMINQYEQQLKMQGLSIEQYLQFTNSKREDLEEQMKPEAENRVKSRYLLEAVAEKEEIKITDADAKKEAKNMASKYGMEEKEFLQAFGGIDVVKYDMKMRKAIEIIKNN